MNQLRPRNTKWLWIAAGLLLLMHQDFWFWDDERLLFGFLPVGLAYQSAFSLVSAALWAWAMLFAWPAHVEAMAND